MTCKIHPRLEKMRRRDVFLVCYAMQCICIDKVALPEGKKKRKKKSPFRMFLESLLDKRVAGFIKNAWEYRVLHWLLSAISSLHPEYYHHRRPVQREYNETLNGNTPLPASANFPFVPCTSWRDSQIHRRIPARPARHTAKSPGQR